jgi:Phosphotransferase enzyme family
MIRALEQRALAAAGAVASAGGLILDEAVVIHAGSNVLVHLRPAPVVARVMTGTVALHSDPRTWLEREISVLAFLGPSGLAVSPSGVIAPGPYCHDSLWMTFTEWIPEVRPDPELQSAADLDDARVLGPTLRDLHDELCKFEGGLGGLRDLGDDIERLLGQLRPSNAQETDAVASLSEQLEVLRTTVFESALPTQALHGDVSLRNLLRTPRRLVWNDFEDTFSRAGALGSRQLRRQWALVAWSGLLGTLARRGGAAPGPRASVGRIAARGYRFDALVAISAIKGRARSSMCASWS